MTGRKKHDFEGMDMPPDRMEIRYALGAIH